MSFIVCAASSGSLLESSSVFFFGEVEAMLDTISLMVRSTIFKGKYLYS